MNSLCEGEVTMGNEGLRVTWDIETIQLLKLVLNLLVSLIEVDWDHSGSSGLKELDMGGFDELFSWEWIHNVLGELSLFLSLPENFILSSDKFLVPFAMLRDWLGEDTNDWVLDLLSDMVSRSDHGRVM